MVEKTAQVQIEGAHLEQPRGSPGQEGQFLRRWRNLLGGRGVGPADRTVPCPFQSSHSVGPGREQGRVHHRHHQDQGDHHLGHDTTLSLRWNGVYPKAPKVCAGGPQPDLRAEPFERALGHRATTTTQTRASSAPAPNMTWWSNQGVRASNTAGTKKPR